jgi:predicted RNA binding protein YcfA (HicA-like mRNA interferase family)
MPVQISGKEAVKALLKLGFAVIRQKGSHVHLAKEAQGKTLRVTVPVHGNEDLHPFVLRCICRQAETSKEDLIKVI